MVAAVGEAAAVGVNGQVPLAIEAKTKEDHLEHTGNSKKRCMITTKRCFVISHSESSVIVLN